MKHVSKFKYIKFKTFDYRILDDEYNDKRYYISRIFFISFDSNNLYAFFRRVQYLIRLIFNLTIDKLQY